MVDVVDDPRLVDLRQEYRVLSQEEQLQVKGIKDLGDEFIRYVGSLGRSRETALAITHMEDAVMRAVRHVTRDKSGD